MPNNLLFQEVVNLCNLSPLFGEQVVTRACKRAGIQPNAMDAQSVAQILPYIETSLQLFLSPAEASERIRVISAKYPK